MIEHRVGRTIRLTGRGARAIVQVGLCLCLAILLTACSVPRPTIKIALVAPFEGRYREVGYDAFPAFRLALREQMEAGGIGNYEVEFVAYNDNADPAFAERVAHNVTIDNSVIAVIGHLRIDTTLAAIPVYASAQIPFLIPDVPADALPNQPLLFRMGPSSTRLVTALESCRGVGSYRDTRGMQPYQGTVSQEGMQRIPDLASPATALVLGSAAQGLCFATATPYPRDLPKAVAALSAFSQVSGGSNPGPRSISMYDATRVVLAAIRADIQVHGVPSRAGVAEALRKTDYAGLLGTIQFDSSNVWQNAPVYMYQYGQSGQPSLVQ